MRIQQSDFDKDIFSKEESRRDGGDPTLPPRPPPVAEEKLRRSAAPDQALNQPEYAAAPTPSVYQLHRQGHPGAAGARCQINWVHAVLKQAGGSGSRQKITMRGAF